MAHIRKFNENVVPSQLNEEIIQGQMIQDQIEENIVRTIYECSPDLEDYTINVAGSLQFSGTATTEYGDYDYEVKITRTS